MIQTHDLQITANLLPYAVISIQSTSQHWGVPYHLKTNWFKEITCTSPWTCKKLAIYKKLAPTNFNNSKVIYSY